ncbi:amidohydrolase family protein [Curtobacterium sp. Leaf154]|uniref:amidohydrolase family protein n=1 Tax=Curtobacterium sp. Leaf154 TaxID=1736277 RepID=UPI000B015234|nr:amidohydrolase family protein [Curtobacterium sp. Leaf154]
MDLVLTNARLTDGRSVDLVITDGLIASISDTLPGAAAPAGSARVVDCAGRVVIPGLIEAHLHVDKALLDRERPNPDGTLAGAIAVTGELKRGFTHATVRDRARTLLDQAITNGTTLVRAHPDVDPIVGLTGVEVLLDLRDEYRDALDLQIVAFPRRASRRHRARWPCSAGRSPQGQTSSAAAPTTSAPSPRATSTSRPSWTSPRSSACRRTCTPTSPTTPPTRGTRSPATSPTVWPPAGCRGGWRSAT